MWRETTAEYGAYTYVHTTIARRQCMGKNLVMFAPPSTRNHQRSTVFWTNKSATRCLTDALSNAPLHCIAITEPQALWQCVPMFQQCNHFLDLEPVFLCGFMQADVETIRETPPQICKKKEKRFMRVAGGNCFLYVSLGSPRVPMRRTQRIYEWNGRVARNSTESYRSLHT